MKKKKKIGTGPTSEKHRKDIREVKKRTQVGWSSAKKKISDTDRLVIGTLYEEGASVIDLADKYGTTKMNIYQILKEPEVVEVRKVYKQASIDKLWIAFERNSDKIDKLIDSYINEAVLEQRIKRTDLPGLFKVFNSIMNNKIRLKELSLKETEVELKKKLIDSNPEPDTGLIKDLLLVLDKKNNLKYVGQEQKDESDIDDDIKERSKVLQRKEKAEKRFNKHFGLDSNKEVNNNE